MKNLALLMFVLIGQAATAAVDITPFVGSWRYSNSVRPSSTVDESIMPDHSRADSPHVSIMEIQKNGSASRTEPDEKTSELVNRPYGRLGSIKPKGSAETNFVIKLVPQRLKRMLQYFKDEGMKINFNGVAKVTLSQDQSKLVMELPHAIVTYRRVTADEANQAIKDRREKTVEAKVRTARLAQLVSGKTFNLVEKETVQFDEEGNAFDASKVPAEEIPESYAAKVEDGVIREGEENQGAEERSDDQVSRKTGNVRFINPKQITFGQIQPDSLSMSVVINGTIAGEVFFDVPAKDALLEIEFSLKTSAGKYDRKNIVKLFGLSVFLKGERLELRESARAEENPKTGSDTIYRYQLQKQ